MMKIAAGAGRKYAQALGASFPPNGRYALLSRFDPIRRLVDHAKDLFV